MTKLIEIAQLNPKIEKSNLDESSIASFVPMAAVSEITGSVIWEEEREIEKVLKGFTYFQSNDILVAKITPCFENGKIALASVKNKHGFGSTEFHVIRCNQDKVDTRYLFNYLRQPKIRIEGEKRMTGSGGQRRVPKAFLEDLDIPLPPLPEQRRIAAILDKAEALRAKRREAIAKLDQLLQSVFLEMFGDPVTNNKNWREDKLLGDVADICSGITKGRKTTSETKLIPYLAVANVQDKFLKVDVVKEIEATEDEIEKYKLKKHDLLLTEGGDPDKLGRGSLWHDEIPLCIHQNHVFRVRLNNKEINPIYLNWLVGSYRGKRYFLSVAKQTTGIASINLGQLKKFPLLIPPLDLQEKFAKIEEAVREKYMLEQKISLEKIDALIGSIQASYF